MFRCERCGSRYSAMHAVAMENCPRCKFRDGVVAPVAFKAFNLAKDRKPKSLKRTSISRTQDSPSVSA